MKPSDREKVAQWIKSRPQSWIYASAFLLVFILGFADIGVVLNLRENSLRNAEKTLENTSTTLAEEADRAFQSVDLVLTNLMEKLDAAGVVDSESYERMMSNNAVHLLLKEKLNGLPQLDAITMINADGKLINFSRYWPIPPVNVSDRDYFQALKADPSRKFFIGTPVQNRGDGSWTIYLARRVNSWDGKFAGLVLGAMTMQYFEDFYHSVLPADSGAISMIRDDGVLLARYPRTEAIGRTFPDTGGQRALQGGTRGSIREPSPIDGAMRIKAGAQVRNFPLIILATMKEDAVLGNWASVAVTLSLITAGCAIAVALAAIAVGRWSKQQQVLVRAREERSAADGARMVAEAELLRERERSADAANRAKSSFLAMMSHEIRTPMNAVLALTGTLLDDKLDPEKRKVVETIRDSGDNLLRILNDILDYSKMEAGRISLETLAFSPVSLNQSVLSIMGPRAAAKGLFLREQTDPELPQILAGDAGRIRQVLLNLVANAVKFTHAGGVTIATRCLHREQGSATIEWCVSDTGIGIPPDQLRKLFGEFAQADTSITRRFGGTGLGLAISKRIVDQMGGTIGVDSEDQKGTSFRLALTLPIADRPEESTDEHTASEDRLHETLRALGRPGRILVAEDNPTNQFVMAQLLKGFNVRVNLANDGLEAVEAATSSAPDIIFMDMRMPEMDGLEATRAIRRRGARLAEIPIVALTANAYPEDVQACKDAGMNDFIAKPIKKERLITTIVKALAREAPAATPVPSPEPRSEAPQIVDESALAELTRDIGVAGAGEVLATFETETRDRLRRLAESLEPGALLREIHTLKGSARTACAGKLAALAAACEARLRSSGGADLPELPQLLEAYRAYEAELAARGFCGSKAA